MLKTARDFLEYIIEGKRLTRKDSYSLMRGLMEGEFTSSQMGALLSSLRMRKEDGEEISGFAEAMREKAMNFSVSSLSVADNCGTGGDGQGTFNISTASAFVALSSGLKIVKHGNRSVSSRCGSADLLEILGIKVDMEREKMQTLFEETGFAFLYAPLYHPATRTVQGVRKELGIRTVFNLLGPLTNPCPMDYKLVGVYSPELIEPVASTLATLGVKRGLVVWGEPGLDEISTTGESKLAFVEGGKITFSSFHPEEAGFPVRNIEELRGGTPAENARIFVNILGGEEKGARREAVVLNSAFLLWIGEEAQDLEEAIEKVEEAIHSGRALQTLKRVVKVSRALEGE
ncbi:MAG TPA: anthranilate phosphoribosyltransferase [Candidatus Atribacteria bacterium]|nr:anthranilate phosphoribosyltransferase [Candidatus Atribacteria bacterium]